MNILCIVFVLISVIVLAQTHCDTAKKNPLNAVFIEAGGNTFYYSLNYERIFYHHEVLRQHF